VLEIGLSWDHGGTAHVNARGDSFFVPGLVEGPCKVRLDRLRGKDCWGERKILNKKKCWDHILVAKIRFSEKDGGRNSYGSAEERSDVFWTNRDVLLRKG